MASTDSILSTKYNLNVKARQLNLMLLILGFVGIYISGVLTLQHILGVEVPCTAGGGCTTVANHRLSYIETPGLGFVPVAVFGLIGYFLITVINVVRLFLGKITARNLILPGYILSAIGAISSVYLQYLSFTVIFAKCIWCISSAVVMVLMFIGYTLLYSGSFDSSSEEELKREPKLLILGAIGVALASGASALTIAGQNKLNGSTVVVKIDKIDQLIPEKRNQLGKDDAPVTIVEFADLCCAACRRSFPRLKMLKSKYGDNLRIIYRHFPIDHLPGHEQTLNATLLAEIAADEGKFWQFAEAFVQGDEAPKEEEAVFQLAASFGITRKMFDEALEKSDGPVGRMERDRAAAALFGVDVTPKFFLVVKGQPIKTMDSRDLENELANGEASKFLK